MDANQFEHLSAESPEDRLAQMTPEDMAEYNAYLDAMHEAHSRQPEPRHIEPDSWLEEAYEMRTHIED
jgi:hypothetical protein